MQPKINEQWFEDAEVLREWANDVFVFAADTLKMLPSEPIDELRNKPIQYTDAYGVKRQVLLFDEAGRLTYHDLAFYTVDMFKHQSRAEFRQYNGTRFTWQQTITLTAYNRGLWTRSEEHTSELQSQSN